MNIGSTLAIFKISGKIPTSNDLFIICSNGFEINAKYGFKCLVESPSKLEDELAGNENIMLCNLGIVKGVQKKDC